MINKKLILIVGPTAVGKTALSIQAAQYFQTKIISADSRQCFRELNIGVAKPTAQELDDIPHYFINSHSIQEDVNAAMFEQLSLEWAADIFQEHDYAVMVGGTGLYIKAFSEGLDEVPVIDPMVRTQVQEQFHQNGLEWLQEKIRTGDPLFFERGEIQNPQRMMRALEVLLSTGRSVLSYRTHQKKARPFSIIKIGLNLPKEILHERIARRVDSMMEEGLVQEVRSLMPYRTKNALQTVGYRELFDYFDNKITLAEATECIKQNTRQYAKRQLTWFRRDQDIHWMEPGNLDFLKKITES